MCVENEAGEEYASETEVEVEEGTGDDPIPFDLNRLNTAKFLTKDLIARAKLPPSCKQLHILFGQQDKELLKNDESNWAACVEGAKLIKALPDAKQRMKPYLFMEEVRYVPILASNES